MDLNTGAVRPLHTEADYLIAIEQYESFFNHEPEPDTEKADEFELLGLVIAKYEDEHFPIEAPTPVEVIRAVMDARGFEQSDLAAVLGSKSRATEILHGKRALSLEHIRRLHAAWRIPAELLIGA